MAVMDASGFTIRLQDAALSASSKPNEQEQELILKKLGIVVR